MQLRFVELDAGDRWQSWIEDMSGWKAEDQRRKDENSYDRHGNQRPLDTSVSLELANERHGLPPLKCSVRNI